MPTLTKNEKWNKLTGKTILVYDPDFLKWGFGQEIQALKIIGCDPDIAICIECPQSFNSKPYWVSHGKLSPAIGNTKRLHKNSDLVMELIYDQLRSGYFSAPVVEKKIRELCGLMMVGSSPTCPFSL